MELGFGGIDREWCMGLCGSQRVVVTQLELYGFASGAGMTQWGLYSGYELTDLRLCALGLVDVVQWCVSCSREAAVNW